MAADYSKSPLVKKLAIKRKTRITVVNAPDGYREMLGELPEGTTYENKFEGMFDWIQVFVKNQAELDAQVPKLKEKLLPNGILWVSFPRDRKVTDLSRNSMLSIKESHGLDPVSNAVVNDYWTGYRLKHWTG
ncbi:MAG: hypothetical protein ABI700_18080 [Chloroflexota bacterium]